MQFVTFASDDVDNVLSHMTPEELDHVPYGVIQIDAQGTIHIFNYAAKHPPGRKIKAAIGKNFFKEIAPCTNIPGFRDRFDAGVQAGNLNLVFEWQLDGEDLPFVQVHIKKVPDKDLYWIFTRRL